MVTTDEDGEHGSYGLPGIILVEGAHFLHGDNKSQSQVYCRWNLTQFLLVDLNSPWGLNLKSPPPPGGKITIVVLWQSGKIEKKRGKIQNGTTMIKAVPTIL